MPVHTRDVRVNGVIVAMYDDLAEHRFSPMRATLGFLERSPFTIPRDDSPERREAFKRLREAGVEAIPLYESEAVAAGIEWEEVT